MKQDKNIKILDCTLRDGGYVNNWNFGFDNIKEIYDGLKKSKIDFIELGYLDSKRIYDLNYTKYNNQSSIKLCTDNKSSIVMINYGDFDIDSLENYNPNSKFCGIRLAFHKKDINSALDDAKKIKEKGYLLFMQPMVSVSYSDEEFIDLIKKVNEIKPYAFYIVDSFGVMRKKDIHHFSDLTNTYLEKTIAVGFHSHNNLQLALSNTCDFINYSNNDLIIIDSSIYGMGRGAGNLCSELILQFINNSKYILDPIFDIISNIISVIKQEIYWGYSIEYYLSAILNCHPNYSKYLMDKQTINVLDIKNILSNIDDKKRYNYDKSYIEKLYYDYMNNSFDDENSYKILKEIINNKEILLIGPGNSINKNISRIQKYQKRENIITILVNHINDNFKFDFIFTSNKKRYKKINLEDYNGKMILTSNISNINTDKKIIFDYNSCLVSDAKIDNALLMLLKILSKLKVEKVYLAGFDGFDVDIKNNHYDSNLYYTVDRKQIDYLNNIMRNNLEYFKNIMTIEWITNSKYMEVKNENNSNSTNKIE